LKASYLGLQGFYLSVHNKGAHIEMHHTHADENTKREQAPARTQDVLDEGLFKVCFYGH